MNLKILAWTAGRMGLLQINYDMSGRANQEDEISRGCQVVQETGLARDINMGICPHMTGNTESHDTDKMIKGVSTAAKRRGPRTRSWAHQQGRKKNQAKTSQQRWLVSRRKMKHGW